MGTGSWVQPRSRCGGFGAGSGGVRESCAVVVAPTGTVTFLFTDIQGSTALWERHPEQMRQAVRRHDEVVRCVVEERGGYVFTTAGDSFASCFDAAVDAAEAAVGIQRACRDEPWPEVAVIAVRCGLHTGVADERDGDYFGQAPNRAARIMAAANAGQILCSTVTARLLDGVQPVVALGSFRLRDLGEPVELFQVASPDGESFPPPNTLDQTAGNLPVQLTELIGRDELVRTLVEAVGDHRCVTLTGVGGVGKTRLGLQLAAEVAHRFGDGAWLVELAPVRQADEVAQAVLEGLQIPGRPGMTAMDSIIDRLRSAEMLIVLDNCEHVVGPTRQVVEEMLRSCPGIGVLATSREGLGVAGEHIYAVPSLDVPLDDVGVSASPAVRLFVNRALAFGGWELREHDWPWIAELCRRLDGIPLAIELAAGRANVLSVEDIVTRLDDRFRLLTGQRGGSLQRHETLRAAVEWSYELLNEDDRKLFDCLGVFVGSFDLAAATAAAGRDPADSIEVIDGLASLINRSLVQVDRSRATQRYRLLETLRQFAVDRLVESAEIEQVRQAHARHFAVEASRIAQDLRGPDEHNAREALDAAMADHRAAVSWAVDNGEGSLVAALVGPFHHGPAFNLRAITSLASHDAVQVGGEDTTWGMALLTLHAWDAYLGAEPDLASERRELLKPGLASSNKELAIGALIADSALAALTADGPAAADSARRAIDLAEDIGDLFGRGIGSNMLNAWTSALGEPQPGIELAESALRDARLLGNPYQLSYAQFVLAFRLEVSDPDRALEVATAAVEDTSTNRDAGTVACHSIIGRILLRRGDYEEALRHLHAHLRWAHNAGLRVEFAYSARPAAGCLVQLGQPDHASVIFASFPESPWANMAEADRVAEALLAAELNQNERDAAARLDWTEAAELTLSAVADALAGVDQE